MLLIDTMLGNDDLEEKEEMKNALVKQIAKKKNNLGGRESHRARTF